jgi:hypothetical protein
MCDRYTVPHDVIRAISIYIRGWTNKSGIHTFYLSMALQASVGPWPLFQFLNPIHSRSSVARPLPTQRTQTQNKRKQTSMP